jgi:hypothetical protein
MQVDISATVRESPYKHTVLWMKTLHVKLNAKFNHYQPYFVLSNESNIV